MKHLLFIILLTFTAWNTSASRLSGSYGGRQCPKFYIGLYHNGRFECIDSVSLDSAGKFTISLPDNRQGILRIACHNEKNASDALNKADNTSSLQFIYDGQDIVYETSWRWHNSEDYLRVLEGGETTKLVSLQVQKQQQLYEHLSALESVLDKTDRNSAFFSTVDAEYTETIRKYNQELQNMQAAAVPGSMFATVLSCLQEPEVPSGLQSEQRVDWLRNHLFDGIDLNNYLVYNSPFFTNRLRQYLYLWQPKGVVSESEIKASQAEGIRLLKEKVQASAPEIMQALDECLSNHLNQK